MPFLQISAASKSFRTPSGTTAVLRDINLSVERGEFVAIVGYSGSGKTTLLNLLAGLVMPDAGAVTLNGRAVTGPGPDRGVIFQNYSLLPWLSVTQNIALAVDRCFPQWDAAQRRAQVERYIGMVNLTPHAAKLPRQLSGGQRQRVAVARGLAIEPEVLLLDEPLGALDALTRGTLQEEIVRIWEADQRTVVLITNDVDEALLMADRIIPLTTGPGATLDAPIPVTPPRPRVRRELNHDPEFKRLRALVTNRLLGFGARRRASAPPRLALPNVLPEDLTRGRPLLAWGMRARKRVPA